MLRETESWMMVIKFDNIITRLFGILLSVKELYKSNILSKVIW